MIRPFLAGFIRGPLGLITTILAAIPAAVATNPQLIQSFGQAPAPGSDAEMQTQIVSVVLTLLLLVMRGNAKVDPNVLKSFALALFVAACVPQSAYAQIATVSWSAPTKREAVAGVPGVALTAAEISAYEILYSIDGGALVTVPVVIPTPGISTVTTKVVTLSLTPRATKYRTVWQMTAIDTGGRKSARSPAQTIEIDLPLGAPEPPGGIQVLVTCSAVGCTAKLL